jgi:hypothetical protein
VLAKPLERETLQRIFIAGAGATAIRPPGERPESSTAHAATG